MPLNLVSASFQFFSTADSYPSLPYKCAGTSQNQKANNLNMVGTSASDRALKVIVSRRVLGQEVKSLLIVLNHLKSCFSPFECLRTSVGLPGKPARLEPVLSSCTFSDRRVTLHQLHVHDSLDFFMAHNKLFLYTLRRGK